MLGTTTSSAEVGITVLVSVAAGAIFLLPLLAMEAKDWWDRRSLLMAMADLEEEFRIGHPEMRKGDRDHAEAMVRHLQDRIIELDILHCTFHPDEAPPVKLEAARKLLTRWRGIASKHRAVHLLSAH